MVIELKAVDVITDVPKLKFSYLRLGKYKTGLLINFNTKLLSKELLDFPCNNNYHKTSKV